MALGGLWNRPRESPSSRRNGGGPVMALGAGQGHSFSWRSLAAMEEGR